MDMSFPEGHTDESEQLESLTRVEFSELHDKHWQIEQYHRIIKQVWCDWHGQYLAGGIPATTLGIGTCRRRQGCRKKLSVAPSKRINSNIEPMKNLKEALVKTVI